MAKLAHKPTLIANPANYQASALAEGQVLHTLAYFSFRISDKSSQPVRFFMSSTVSVGLVDILHDPESQQISQTRQYTHKR